MPACLGHGSVGDRREPGGSPGASESLGGEPIVDPRREPLGSTSRIGGVSEVPPP